MEYNALYKRIKKVLTSIYNYVINIIITDNTALSSSSKILSMHVISHINHYI